MGEAGSDRVRAEARRLLASGVAGSVFPGASACASHRAPGGAAVFSEACAGRGGPPAVPPTARPIDEGTLFDLASLTKPLVAAVALRLVVRGVLTLETRADSVLSDARGTPGGAATLEQLLTHRSGLAAWGGLYLDVPHEPGTTAARRWIVAEACRRPDEGPRDRAVYSDLGYMIAGEVIAKAAGCDLEVLLGQEVLRPLGIPDDQMLYVGALSSERRADVSRRCAATERDDWRGVLVRGEVHDENCAALGGVAGHAGVFATARAVAVFGRAYLDCLSGRSEYLPRALVTHAVSPRPGGTHLLGWDAKSAEKSAAGKRMSPRSFGHLGFTGTSVYLDPVRDCAVVLLTNRVCPSRANEKIKGFRPAFHDGLVAVLDAGR